jgi:hypothetical protein
MKALIIEDLQETIAPLGASDSVGGLPCVIMVAFYMLR